MTIQNEFLSSTSSKEIYLRFICVKFFLANRFPTNWIPIRQRFILRVTMEPIGQCGLFAKQEFTKSAMFFLQISKTVGMKAIYISLQIKKMYLG